MPFGIRHIEILVSDFEKSVPFYEGFFSCIGWEQIDETGFKCGDTKIYLKKSSFDDERTGTLGARHICFHADDIETLEVVRRFLRKHRIKIIRGPIELIDDWHPEGGYHTVDFYDPDGYILEVSYKE